MSMHINILRLKVVAEVLSSLNVLFVFVGGATVSLYASDPNLATEVRPTDDVDVVVELATYSGFVQLEERLREVGFVNDLESGELSNKQWPIYFLYRDVIPMYD